MKGKASFAKGGRELVDVDHTTKYVNYYDSVQCNEEIILIPITLREERRRKHSRLPYSVEEVGDQLSHCPISFIDEIKKIVGQFTVDFSL